MVAGVVEGECRQRLKNGIFCFGATCVFAHVGHTRIAGNGTKCQGATGGGSSDGGAAASGAAAAEAPAKKTKVKVKTKPRWRVAVVAVEEAPAAAAPAVAAAVATGSRVWGSPLDVWMPKLMHRGDEPHPSV